MDTRGNDRLRDLLAAEYALGTLRGGARRRFERWARSDADLQALAYAWSERLVPLIDGLPSRVPPDRVWKAVEARLHGPSQPAGGWWERLAFWRGLSAALAAVAVVGFAIALRPQPVTGPVVVQAPPQIVQAPPTIVEGPAKVVEGAPKVVAVDAAPTAVATLVDAKSGKPVAVVLEARGGALTVKVSADVEVAEGKALQLWMASDDSPNMISLGMLPADAKAGTVRMEPRVAGLDRAKAFGLSLEPAGGSPQPTTVLGLGTSVRM